MLITAADSDGSSTLQSAPTTVISAPPPASSPNGGLESPPTIGTPNGTGASELAHLELGETQLSRTFAHRALRITGKLTNATGAPIGAATLDVHEQVAGSDSEELIGHTSTAPDGTFSVEVTAGPSRRLEIGYRAFSSDVAYAAQGTVVESVKAGVQLHVSPRWTDPGGRITLSGQVAGPVPRGGVLVELLVHYRGAWVPFRAPRTSDSGRFKTAYQFQGATGRFPFRAEIPAGQVGFPYAAGYSSAITVRSG